MTFSSYQSFFIFFLGLLLVGTWVAIFFWFRQKSQTLEQTWKATLDQQSLALSQAETKNQIQTQQNQTILTWMRDSLDKTQNRLQELTQLSSSVQDLSRALQMPQMRGSLGEYALTKILTDILPPGSFALQASLSEKSIERCDAVVLLEERKVPVDSKFPRESYLKWIETRDPKAKKDFEDTLKIHAKSIAQKYIQEENGTTPYALMFLPSESLYYECIMLPALMESLEKLKVFPVSPSTLSLTLHNLAQGLRVLRLSKEAKKWIQQVMKASKVLDKLAEEIDDLRIVNEKALQKSFQVEKALSQYRKALSLAESRFESDDHSQENQEQSHTVL